MKPPFRNYEIEAFAPAPLGWQLLVARGVTAHAEPLAGWLTISVDGDRFVTPARWTGNGVLEPAGAIRVFGEEAHRFSVRGPQSPEQEAR